MSSRQEELLAKRARLAELKRQRELRQESSTSKRQSIGGDTSSPGRLIGNRKSEVDDFVNSLLDKRRESNIGTAKESPGRRDRQSSFYGGQADSNFQDGPEPSPRTPRPQMVSIAIQTSPSNDVDSVSHETAPAQPVQPPKKEYITYSKGVQTESHQDASTSLPEDQDDIRLRSRRRSSKRDKEAEEEIRVSLRKEIEDELKATHNGDIDYATTNGHQRYPLRTLNEKELNAVTASSEFVSFVERSSKVIERALDEEYDLLADYTRSTTLNEDDDDTPYNRHSKNSHSLRESIQLFSDRHSRRRGITDLQFSPHFSELLLSSYTKSPAPNEPPGQVLLWNIKAPSRPEYVFTSTSDVLCARFSPFHPNLIIGGCYSGQICLWDTRSPHPTPVQRTPVSGSHLTHTHPVYNLSIIGTPNAHNIITASMDGVVCSWSFDMLTQASEYLHLHTPAPPAKTEDLAPTSLSFPSSDPTFFLVGTEEGSIYPCHRYDRAGAKAGVDRRIAYRGHTAPVMSTHFHPSTGPVDLSDLLLSSSSDWSLKLWRVKPAASSSAGVGAPTTTNAAKVNGSSATDATAATAGSTANTRIATTTTATGSTSSNHPTPLGPLLTIPREDLIYSARWHPHRPSIFSCVTGSGHLEVFDLLYDSEVPVATASPSRSSSSRGGGGALPFRGLNKVAWEEGRGSKIAVGGLDGVVTVFETGKGLQGGMGEGGNEEWVGVRKMVARGGGL